MAIVLKYDKLRYRLLPCIYLLAAKNTFGNYTMMRSLAFDFGNNTNVYKIPDQYTRRDTANQNKTQFMYSGEFDIRENDVVLVNLIKR